jgi:hypothetical protein
MLLPDFAAGGGVADPGGSTLPPEGSPYGGELGGTLGGLLIIVGATGDWDGGVDGLPAEEGVEMIVASVAGAGGAGGCMVRSVIFGSTIVSLPPLRGGSLAGGTEAGDGMLASSRAPQLPQKRSSGLTSLWQFGHCAMWLPLHLGS